MLKILLLDLEKETFYVSQVRWASKYFSDHVEKIRRCVVSRNQRREIMSSIRLPSILIYFKDFFQTCSNPVLFPKNNFSKVHLYGENIFKNILSDAKTNYELNFIWIVLIKLNLKFQSENLLNILNFIWGHSQILRNRTLRITWTQHLICRRKCPGIHLQSGRKEDIYSI